MHVRPRLADGDGRERKPRILLVLQGIHHLMLYENIFRLCPEFQWMCLLPALPKDDGELNRFYFRYGVRFFSDRQAALAHFHGFDAVVTTWAVPHRKHLPYAAFIALAYELGVPAFELQHGLFQVGITYSEEAAVIGSREQAATAAADMPNFLSNEIRWFGEDGVGYPRAYGLDDQDRTGTIGDRAQVAFLTNHHWNILSARERSHCYAMMRDAIASMPAVDFLLLPHSGEFKLAAYNEMIAYLNAIKATNFRVEKSRDSYDRILRESSLLIGTLSTTLLDCELSGTPTVIFGNPSQEQLVSTFKQAVVFSSSEQLIQIVNDVIYRSYRPQLVTGYAKTFEPQKLVSMIEAAIAHRPPVQRERAIAAMARYADTSA